MASLNDHPFARTSPRFRSDLAAFVVTAVAAAGILAFDLGTTANAADGLDAVGAVESARAQGFEGSDAAAETRYDRIARRAVWDVRGTEGEHAVIDAGSGELMSLEF